MNDEEINLNDHRHLDTLQSIEAVKNVSVSAVLTYLDDIVVVNTAAGNVTITLPKARGGKKFCVIKGHASNAVTVNFSGGETMLGTASVIITSLADRRWFKSVPGGYIPL